MPRRRESIDTVSEILVDPQPRGLRAVFLVETRSREEALEVDSLFAELSVSLQVRQLSSGKLVSYAVQADEADATTLDEIEAFLKANYQFVVTQRSFDELICRIVSELSQDTGSRVIPVPRCNICGKHEPFPGLVVNLADEEGAVLISRSYCSNCTARESAPSNKEFVRSLLAADEKDFSILERAELVRRPSRKQPIRFKIKGSV